MSALTPREKQIIALVISGIRNRDIAEQLGIGVQSVKNHLQRIFDKTGMDNRVELTVFFLQRPELQ